MQLYPAIDIKNGQCVRLSQGLFDKVKVYDNSPKNMAMHWESQGATYLHVVDLDGALAGHPVNLEAIHHIVRSVGIPVEVGGGIPVSYTHLYWLLFWQSTGWCVFPKNGRPQTGF